MSDASGGQGSDGGIPRERIEPADVPQDGAVKRLLAEARHYLSLALSRLNELPEDTKHELGGLHERLRAHFHRE